MAKGQGRDVCKGGKEHYLYTPLRTLPKMISLMPSWDLYDYKKKEPKGGKGTLLVGLVLKRWCSCAGSCAQEGALRFKAYRAYRLSWI